MRVDLVDKPSLLCFADSSPLHVERMEENSCSVSVPYQETCYTGKSFHVTLFGLMAHNTGVGRVVLEAK